MAWTLGAAPSPRSSVLAVKPPSLAALAAGSVLLGASAFSSPNSLGDAAAAFVADLVDRLPPVFRRSLQLNPSSIEDLWMLQSATHWHVRHFC